MTPPPATAVPVAVCPPAGAAAKARVGCELYPDPALVIVTDLTEVEFHDVKSAIETFNELPFVPAYLAAQHPFDASPPE